jgi:hypothetical protein
LAKFADRCILAETPNRNIKPTTEQDAVSTPPRHDKEYELKLAALREALQAGIDAAERGEYEDVDEADLDAYLDKLGR